MRFVPSILLILALCGCGTDEPSSGDADGGDEPAGSRPDGGGGGLAPTASLVASPAAITAGATSTLTWTSTHATQCSGTNFTASGTAGAMTVSPTSTTTYAISCQGSGGSTSASATVTVGLGGCAEAIPLRFDDPVFVGVVESEPIVISDGGTVIDTSIVEESGDPSIVALGAAAVSRTRVRSREAFRVAGSGLVGIDCSWLEAQGTGDDHADVIQAYAPGADGTIQITNTTVRAYNAAATAGLFVADNWTGTVRLEKVVFWGGPYGLRLHSDVGGDLHIYVKDVYFVEPFAYGPYLITGEGGTEAIVEQWDNVRRAEIVDGVLVPGDPLPPP